MTDDIPISERYTVPRRCTQCNIIYLERNNLGQHLCRIHPGLRLCDNKGHAYYSCCGLRITDVAEGNIMRSDSQGCLKIDHSDAVFSDNNVMQRIREIRSFAVGIIPDAMFEFNFVRPQQHTIIYHCEGGPGCKALEIRFGNVFTECYDNNSRLMLAYDPYRDIGHHDMRIDHEMKPDDGSSLDTTFLNLQEISSAYNQSAFAVALRRRDEEARDRSKRQKTRRHYQHDDGWSYDQGDGEVLSHNRGPTALSFIVFTRIGHKLNIHPTFSKLYEKSAL